MIGRILPRASGFTLVELQIALVILALMAALMSGALRLSSKTWRSVNAQQDRVEHRYLMAQYLRRHLSGARFLWVSTEENGSVIGFFGNAKQINFVAAYPAYHNDGELYWWNLKLEKDPEFDQYNLVASYFPFNDGGQVKSNIDPDISDDNKNDSLDMDLMLKFDNDGGVFIEGVEPTRIIIAENMADLAFEYFYRDGDGVHKWVEEWSPGAKAPLVIGIQIASATGGNEPGEAPEHAALPRIVVTPRYAEQIFYAEPF